MVHVAVLILNWNGARDALECVSSVLASSYRDYSYAVVDNGSTDGSLRVLREALGPERVKSVGRNKGYAGGMNHAIEVWMQTEARFGLLLTQDVRLERSTLAVLMDALTSESDLGIVGPVIINRRNGAVFNAGGYIRRGHIVHTTAISRETPEAPKPSCPIERVQWADGCCLLLRREVIESVGVFDERFFMYVEEIDLCHRASKVGWGIGVVKSARASQVPGGTSSPPAREYYNYRNNVLFFKKHFGTKALVHTVWSYAYWNLLPLARLGGRRGHARMWPFAMAGLVGIVHGIVGRSGEIPRWLARRISS